jgi:hypothetical protein
MFDWFVSAISWCGRIVKVLLRSHSVVKEHYAAVAPQILLVRKIHHGLLRGAFDASEMRTCLQRLGKSEDAIWSDAKCFHCREAFLSYATAASDVLQKHGHFRNEIEASEYRLFLNNATDRLIAALEKSSLPKQFDPHEDEPISAMQRWKAKLRGRSSNSRV